MRSLALNVPEQQEYRESNANQLRGDLGWQLKVNKEEWEASSREKGKDVNVYEKLDIPSSWL